MMSYYDVSELYMWYILDLKSYIALIINLLSNFLLFARYKMLVFITYQYLNRDTFLLISKIYNGGSVTITCLSFSSYLLFILTRFELYIHIV